MVKTQIQIPDHLFREAKRIAGECEMSFAQVVRMGLEGVVRQFPPARLSPDEWQPPVPVDMGAPLVAEEHWDALCHGEE
ncbi:MAG: antitoxin [Spartobacteria bacterium]